MCASVHTAYEFEYSKCVFECVSVYLLEFRGQLCVHSAYHTWLSESQPPPALPSVSIQSTEGRQIPIHIQSVSSALREQGIERATQ